MKKIILAVLGIILLSLIEGRSGEIDTEHQLRMNFQDAPLETVLDYLSQTAGFVVLRDAPLTNRVNIVSHQPMGREEAVALLHNVLVDNGYGLIREGRVLRIVKRDEAATKDLPVQFGNQPESVGKGGEMITQIIPIRHTDAGKLVETIRPLLPPQSIITANEDSNALVMTDTRTNIHRIMLVIQALDTTVSSILDIRVVPLEYADAQETADIINKVHETPTAAGTRQARDGTADRRARFIARMRGGEQDDSGSVESGAARQASSYVNAVADVRGNAVIVTAPAEMQAQISLLIEQLDMPSEAFTDMRVFPLRYADASEMAEVIAELYPDPTAAAARTDAQRGTRRGQQPQPQESQGGSRKMVEAKVLAVADRRTNSLIVNASPATMEVIAKTIENLDTTPANVPTVYIYRLENADVNRAKEIIENMFDRVEQGGGTTPAATQTGRNPGGAGR